MTLRKYKNGIQLVHCKKLISTKKKPTMCVEYCNMCDTTASKYIN